MKKIFVVLALMLCGFGWSNINAANGEIKDDRVWYTYWDQTDWGVAYTGVVNYLDYQIYAPCVARKDSEWGCGGFAMQNEYREYGMDVTARGHSHGLMNKDRGIDYVVE